MKKIYGITGMPLSGKTKAAEILQEQHNYELIDMGDIVRKEREKKGIKTEKTGQFVNQLREKHGRHAIAKLTTSYIKKEDFKNSKIVITGMRSLEEKQYFENNLETSLEIIAIWASQETRKTRMRKRQRPEDQNSETFEQRDQRELKNGVGNLMAKSEHLIKNDSNQIQELKQQINEIL